jgi:rare lipoprotein A (peptidoglycan hydrolase)
MTMRDQGDAAPSQGDARPSRVLSDFVESLNRRVPIQEAPTVQVQQPADAATAGKALPPVEVGADTTGGAKVMREHTVQSGDRLWTIARNQLRQSGVEASGSTVNAYINQIVEANREHNPGLVKNRNRLDVGDKIALPEYRKPDGQQPERTTPAGTERQPRPERERQPDESTPRYTRRNDDAPAKTIRASWYGGYFHGRKTASGDTYDQDGMTAAHKTLPLGSMIEVSNPKNGQSLILRVNDRGPFIEGRDLDLSRGAARHLGTIEQGVATLKMKVIGMGPRRVRNI